MAVLPEDVLVRLLALEFIVQNEINRRLENAGNTPEEIAQYVRDSREKMAANFDENFRPSEDSAAETGQFVITAAVDNFWESFLRRLNV